MRRYFLETSISKGCSMIFESFLLILLYLQCSAQLFDPLHPTTYSLNVKRLNLDQYERLNYAIAIPLINNHGHAIDICKLLKTNEANLFRCLTSVDKTLRLLKVSAIGDFNLVSYGLENANAEGLVANMAKDDFELPMDGLTHRMTYIYDAIKYPFSESHKNVRVCIVGSVSLHLLHTIFMTNPLSRVTYFVDRPTLKDISLYTRYKKLLDPKYSDSLEFVTLPIRTYMRTRREHTRTNGTETDADYQAMKSYRILPCHILHVRQDSIMEVEQIWELLKRVTAASFSEFEYIDQTNSRDSSDHKILTTKEANAEEEDELDIMQVVWERRLPPLCNRTTLAFVRHDHTSTDSIIRREHCEWHNAYRNYLLFGDGDQQDQFRCHSKHPIHRKNDRSDDNSTGRREDGASEGICITWDFAGRFDLEERYELLAYADGMYGSIYSMSSVSPSDLFVGTVSKWRRKKRENNNIKKNAEKVSTEKVNQDRCDDWGERKLEDSSSSDAQQQTRAAPDTGIDLSVSDNLDEATTTAVPAADADDRDDGIVSIRKRDVIVFITYANRVFDDTAAGLFDALISTGYEHTCIMGDFNPVAYRLLRQFSTGKYTLNQFQAFHRQNSPLCMHPAYEPLQRGDDYGGSGDEAHHTNDSHCHNQAHDLTTNPEQQQQQQQQWRPALLQIVVGPHEPMLLSPFYIAFQFEHPHNNIFSQRQDDYMKIFRDALLTWDFSYDHKTRLVSDYDMSEEDIYIIPIYTRSFHVRTDKSANELMVEAHRHGVYASPFTDIAFHGSCSPRREEIISSSFTSLATLGYVTDFFCQPWYSLLFGEERYLRLMATKVVLNIHTDENSCLEVHRINYLLSLGKCIISERSPLDPLLDADYADALIFAENIPHMLKLAAYFVDNDDERKRVEARALRKFRAVEANHTVLEASMKEARRRIGQIIHRHRHHHHTPL